MKESKYSEEDLVTIRVFANTFERKDLAKITRIEYNQMVQWLGGFRKFSEKRVDAICLALGIGLPEVVEDVL